MPVMVRQIHGHSMMPVLPPGTIVYGWRWYLKLRPGDTVIFEHNKREKIKRIEKIDNNRVYLIGDHPGASTDSRHFGWLDIDAIVAKVVWPHAPRHRAEGINPS